MDESFAKVRCERNLTTTIREIVLGPLVVGILTSIGIAMLLTAQRTMGNLAFSALLLGIAVFQFLSRLGRFHWIEYDRPFIRGKRLWTRVVVEQDIRKLTAIHPFRFPGPGELAKTTKKIEQLTIDELIRKVRVCVFRFSSGPTLRVDCRDMKDSDLLVEAVLKDWADNHETR